MVTFASCLDCCCVVILESDHGEPKFCATMRDQVFLSALSIPLAFAQSGRSAGPGRRLIHECLPMRNRQSGRKPIDLQ